MPNLSQWIVHLWLRIPPGAVSTLQSVWPGAWLDVTCTGSTLRSVRLSCCWLVGLIGWDQHLDREIPGFSWVPLKILKSWLCGPILTVKLAPRVWNQSAHGDGRFWAETGAGQSARPRLKKRCLKDCPIEAQLVESTVQIGSCWSQECPIVESNHWLKSCKGVALTWSCARLEPTSRLTMANSWTSPTLEVPMDQTSQHLSRSIDIRWDAGFLGGSEPFRVFVCQRLNETNRFGWVLSEFLPILKAKRYDIFHRNPAAVHGFLRESFTGAGRVLAFWPHPVPTRSPLNWGVPKMGNPQNPNSGGP
jgi:hypothetical protein